MALLLLMTFNDTRICEGGYHLCHLETGATGVNVLYKQKSSPSKMEVNQSIYRFISVNNNENMNNMKTILRIIIINVCYIFGGDKRIFNNSQSCIVIFFINKEPYLSPPPPNIWINYCFSLDALLHTRCLSWKIMSISFSYFFKYVFTVTSCILFYINDNLHAYWLSWHRDACNHWNKYYPINLLYYFYFLTPNFIYNAYDIKFLKRKPRMQLLHTALSDLLTPWVGCSVKCFSLFLILDVQLNMPFC